MKKEIATGSITQLTHVIADGISMSVPRVMANGGDRFGSQILGVVNVVMPNDVSGSTAEGMGSGVDVRDSAVSVSVPQGMDMVNGVRANGVSESVNHGIGDGIMANGVREVVCRGMVNGVRNNGVSKANRESIYEVVVDEVVEDLGRLREYRSIAHGLKVVVRRRRERIHQLHLLRNSHNAVATIRFWERMQLEDVEKGTRAFFMMKESEVKIGEKANYILNLRRGGVLTAHIEEREYFIDALDILADRFVPEKMAEFMKETQEKDRNRLMRLEILGREFELRADKKKHFIEKLKGNFIFVCVIVELVWLVMLVDFFVRWSMCEDYRLASEINRVATEVNSVTMQRERFLEELDSLGTRRVHTKMAEFLRDILRKDEETVSKLQVLVREMELNEMFKLEDVAMGIWIADLKKNGLEVRSFKKLDTGFFDLMFVVDIAIVVEDSTTLICSGCSGVGDSPSSSFKILIVGIGPLLLPGTNIHMFLM
nr:hypothetical protein [Tanacetum cinerariifolium]